MQNGEAFYRALLSSDCVVRVLDQMKQDCIVKNGQRVNESVSILIASRLLDCAELDQDQPAPLCGTSLECITATSEHLLPWARMFSQVEDLCLYLPSANKSLAEMLETIIEDGGGSILASKIELFKSYIVENKFVKAVTSQICWIPALEEDFHYYRIIPYICFFPIFFLLACCCMCKRTLLCFLGATGSEALLACVYNANGDYLISIIIRYYWFCYSIHLNNLFKKMLRFYITKFVTYVEERKARNSNVFTRDTSVKKTTRARSG